MVPVPSDFHTALYSEALYFIFFRKWPTLCWVVGGSPQPWWVVVSSEDLASLSVFGLIFTLLFQRHLVPQFPEFWRILWWKSCCFSSFSTANSWVCVFTDHLCICFPASEFHFCGSFLFFLSLWVYALKTSLCEVFMKLQEVAKVIFVYNPNLYLEALYLVFFRNDGAWRKAWFQRMARDPHFVLWEDGARDLFTESKLEVNWGDLAWFLVPRLGWWWHIELFLAPLGMLLDLRFSNHSEIVKQLIYLLRQDM